MKTNYNLIIGFAVIFLISITCVYAASNPPLRQPGDALQTTFSYPVYVTAQQGQSIASQLELRNAGNLPEYINISVGNYTNMIALSANGTYLRPNQSVGITLLLNSSEKIGTYYLPLKIETSANGINNMQIKYITLIVQAMANGTPSISSQVDVNDTGSTTGLIQISAPANKGISNMTLKSVIVSPLSKNISVSQITAYGIDNNITIQNNSYVITWYIGRLPPGKTVYAYYTINNQSSVTLTRVNEIFQEFSSGNQTARNLKILNIILPTLYQNSTGNATVQTFYTGNTTQNISFSLTTLSSGAKIYNSVQVVSAYPNQFINRSFPIVTSEGFGTILLNLSIRGAGINDSYQLSATVLPKSVSIPYLAIIAVLLGVIVTILNVVLYVRRRSKYRSAESQDSDTKAAASESMEDQGAQAPEVPEMQEGKRQIKGEERDKEAKSKGRRVRNEQEIQRKGL